jgi:hypothetical protein
MFGCSKCLEAPSNHHQKYCRVLFGGMEKVERERVMGVVGYEIAR